MGAFPFVTRPTELHLQHCLNARHSEARCSRCSDNCPSEAVTLGGISVSLNLDLCSGCGLCLHVCPAEVFETLYWSERTPLANVSALKTTQVDFFCGQHPHPETGHCDVGSLQIPTCLAAMSPGAWFELGLGRAVHVRLDACAECPLAVTTIVIERAVDLANDWLRDAGYAAAITCMTAANAPETTGQRPVLDGEHRRMSRRGFFRLLFCPERTRDTAPNSAGGTWNSQDAPKRTPRLPAWMAHAASAFAKNARTTTELAAIWPTITVSDACVVCDACTDYCPTGALEIEASTEDYAITFKAGQCVDCRICWASCPVGAITRAQGAVTAPFERQRVLQQRIAACMHCGRPAAAGESVCYWCAEEPPLAVVMTDARRWLLAAPVAGVTNQTR